MVCVLCVFASDTRGAGKCHCDDPSQSLLYRDLFRHVHKALLHRIPAFWAGAPCWDNPQHCCQKQNQFQTAEQMLSNSVDNSTTSQVLPEEGWTEEESYGKRHRLDCVKFKQLRNLYWFY